MRFLILPLLVSTLLPTLRATDVFARPNIIVILADDYGWGSAVCYGADGVKTPNLDRLAREGRRFTDAYSSGSVCSPGRYGLMTGRYYWRTYIKDGEVLPGDAVLHIEPSRMTLASLCKSQGYRTAAFGKWHLGLQEGARTDWNEPLRPGPLAVGFDYFYGLAANPWNGPHSFIEDEEILGRIPGELVAITGNNEKAVTAGLLKQYETDHIMEILTDKVTDWIEANQGHPFFCYFAMTAVHEPIAPNPKFTGSPHGKYGDFINELDWSVGRILDTLDTLHLANNTLVIFTSDNGGVVKGHESSEAIKTGLKINGNLRGGKHEIWEGGFREPFLVRWPGHVPAGTVSNQVLCLTDVLATFSGVLNVPLPMHNAEDSVDMLRAFTEETPGAPVRDSLVLQSGGGVYAIRMGDWKLVEYLNAPKIKFRWNKKAETDKQGQRDLLFNLKTDPAEEHDVSAANPEIVARMKLKLQQSRDNASTRANAEPKAE